MKLEFNRKSKRRMVGIRLTEEEYEIIYSLSKKNKVSVAETSAVLIRAAIKEIKKVAVLRSEEHTSELQSH